MSEIKKVAVIMGSDSDLPVVRKAAEVLKCTEGNAFGNVDDRSMAQYKSELGMHDVSIPRGDLNRIIRDRLADILVRVGKRVPEEVWKQSGMSVYLSGGTSLMRGLDCLAHHIYGVPYCQESRLWEAAAEPPCLAVLFSTSPTLPPGWYDWYRHKSFLQSQLPCPSRFRAPSVTESVQEKSWQDGYR